MEWDENHHRTETPAKDRSDMTVLPIAFYVSEGRLCARLPIGPHRGWVSYDHSLLEETWRAIEECLTKIQAEDCQAEYLRR